MTALCQIKLPQIAAWVTCGHVDRKCVGTEIWSRKVQNKQVK